MALTLQRKRQIDILLPTLLATAAGVMVFRKKANDWRLLIAAIIGAFVLGYIITSQVTKIAYSQGPAAVPVPANEPQAQSFNGLPLAQRLYDDIYTWGVRNGAPYRDLMNLTDGQFIQVYNAWNKTFFAEDNETLPVAINGESVGLDVSFNQIKPLVMARFARLNLQ